MTETVIQDMRRALQLPKPYSCGEKTNSKRDPVWSAVSKATWAAEVIMRLSRPGPLKVMAIAELHAELCKAILGYKPNAGEFRLFLETMFHNGDVMIIGATVRAAVRRR